jgi:SAM-dependent methyltransferase
MDWLDAYARTYYFCPSLALWRALEAQTLGEEVIRSPSLDVGAFDGSFAAAWLGNGAQFDVGIDLTPRRSRASTAAYKALVAGDAQHLPFPDSTFNFVLCNSVVEHIPDDLQAIHEIARIIRPGGMLLMSTPSVYFHDSLHTVREARKRGDEATARKQIAEIDKRAFHYRYRPLDEWKSILRDAGLSIDRHAYCVPPDAAASWERWDRRGLTRIFGRDMHGYIASRKLARIVPPALWANLFRIALKRDYVRAVEQQADRRSIGVNLVIRAERVAGQDAASTTC